MQKVPGIEMHLDFSKKGDNNMKKVKLTQEQADLIEGYKKRGISDALKFIEAFSVQNRFVLLSNQCLNSLAVEELSICLLVSDSYEVIPQYNVGDWVINIHTGEIGQVEEIKKVEGALGNNERIIVNSTINYPHSLRHATPEEIQQEKKRRFWERLGREVDVYKSGDIVTSGTGDYTAITNLEIKMNSVCFESIEAEYGAEYSFDDIRLVTPVEQRLDK